LPPYHQTRSFSVTCSGQDDASGSGFRSLSLFFRVDGGPWTGHPGVYPTGPIGFVAQSDGVYDFYTVATDEAGNTEAAPVTPDASTVVDTVVPVVTIDSPAADDWLRSAIVEVAWTVVESGSGIEHCYVILDGGSIVDVVLATTHTFDQLSEGSHTVSIRVLDRAGNSGETSVGFKIDVTAPSVTIAEPTSGSELLMADVAVSWISVESGSGIDHYEVKLDSGAFVNTGTARTYVFRNVAEGSHTVTVKAMDVAGNERTAATSFIVHADWKTGGGSHGWLPLIGLVILIVSMCLVIILLCRRRRSRKKPSNVQSYTAEASPEEYQESPVIQEEELIEGENFEDSQGNGIG